MTTILEMKRKARARAEEELKKNGEIGIIVMYDMLAREFHTEVARIVVMDLLSEGMVKFK